MQIKANPIDTDQLATVENHLFQCDQYYLEKSTIIYARHTSRSPRIELSQNEGPFTETNIHSHHGGVAHLDDQDLIVFSERRVHFAR